MDELDDLQKCYENTFKSLEGQKVMGDILFRLGHFGETMDPRDLAVVAEYNVAVTIARMARVLDPLYRQLGMVEEGKD